MTPKTYSVVLDTRTGEIVQVGDHTTMDDLMHDCPLCREERERTGKAPEPIFSWTAGIDPPIEELAREAARAVDLDPNWWHGRKRRRRARQRGRR